MDDMGRMYRTIRQDKSEWMTWAECPDSGPIDDRTPAENTEFLSKGRMQVGALLVCDSLTVKYFELIAAEMQHAC
jgi:hypothetical protein